MLLKAIDRALGWLERHSKIALMLGIAVVTLTALMGWNYYDIMWWIEWDRIASQHGLFSVYAHCIPPLCKAPYPPLAVLVFLASYRFATLVSGSVLWATMLVLKLLLVILPGLAIYLALSRYVSRAAGILWLFSLPFLQIVFALQFDVFLAALLLASGIALLRKRYTLAGLFASLAVLVKQSAMVVIPVMLIALIASRNRGGLARFVLGMIPAAALIAPFMLYSPAAFLYDVFLFHSTRIPQDLSLWAIPTHILGGYVANIWILKSGWVIPFALSYIALLVYMWRRRLWEERGGILLAMALALLLFIVFGKIGNFNYLVWPLPLAVAGLYFIDRRRCIEVATLFSIAIVVAHVPYITLLYLVPATLGRPIFVAEDLSFWPSRVILESSLNSNLAELPLVKVINATNTAIVNTLNKTVKHVVSELYTLRGVLMSLAAVVGQIVLTMTLILMIRHSSSPGSA